MGFLREPFRRKRERIGAEEHTEEERGLRRWGTVAGRSNKETNLRSLNPQTFVQERATTPCFELGSREQRDRGARMLFPIPDLRIGNDVESKVHWDTFRVYLIFLTYLYPRLKQKASIITNIKDDVTKEYHATRQGILRV